MECQTPFFLAAEVDEEGRVRIWFDCPPEPPTVRGYAGILSEGLNGATVDEVLDLPADFYMAWGCRRSSLHSGCGGWTASSCSGSNASCGSTLPPDR